MSTGEQVLARGGLTDVLAARRYRLGPRLEPAENRQPVLLPPPPAVDVPAIATEPRFHFWGRLRLAPAWLVSLVVHLLAVNLLAVFCLAPQAPVDRRTIIANAVAQQSPLETLEAVAFEIAPPLTSSPIDSANEAILANASATTDSVIVDLHPIPTADNFRGRGGGALLDIPREALRNAVDYPHADFFGIKATGSSFVFVIDSSRSMRNGKFAAAKEELARAIRQLSSDQSFYVLFFDNNTARMTLSPNDHPEPSPVPATPENLAKVIEWMDTIEIEPETQPLEALQAAVEMLPDAIFLLSDGDFTDKGAAIRYLSRHNFSSGPSSSRKPRVAIHTIAFWQTESVKTMMLIANTYGGIYRFVPPPK